MITDNGDWQRELLKTMEVEKSLIISNLIINYCCFLVRNNIKLYRCTTIWRESSEVNV